MNSVMPIRRWLSPPRLMTGLWLGLLLLDVIVFAAGLTVWFPRLQEVCYDTNRACQSQLRVSATNVQELQAQGWSLAAYAWYTLGTRGLAKLLGIGLGVLVFWRRPASRMALVASLFLILGLEGSVYSALALVVPAWWLATRVLTFAGIVCFGLFFYIFPNGEFVPSWTRRAALAWAVVFGFDAFFPGTLLSINQWPLPVVFPVFVGFMGSFGWAQIQRYRTVSSPAERLQTRWVVFATAISLLIFMLTASLAAGRERRFTQWWLLADLGFTQTSVLVPAAIGIAVLRHRLWDIDVIIRRTLVYSVVSAALGGVYIGSVLVLQNVFRALTGQADTPVVTVLSTLAIAALFGPLRSRVQAFIDRRFYRRKYDAARTLAQFAAAARDETDLQKLSEHLTSVVQDTMQPQEVGLWLKQG